VRPEGLSMKNSNDTIGNLTCDLPVCSAVPQPTAPPRLYSRNALEYSPTQLSVRWLNEMYFHIPETCFGSYNCNHFQAELLRVVFTIGTLASYISYYN
jgi:hypothetical protein